MFAAALLLVALAQGQPAGTIQPGELHLAGRTLSDALDTIAARGLRVHYASDVVRPEMRVDAEPRGTTLGTILEEILQAHGLTIQVERDGSLTVVTAPRFNENVDVAARARPGVRRPAAWRMSSTHYSCCPA
jgi:hypothetical protein